MTNILGISAFYHDSAVALVVDGRIVAAAQEERFSRKKHDADFPQQAVDYCLGAGGLQPEDLDYVGFYDKPLLKFERLLETYLAFAPRGYRSFRQALPRWLNEKLHLPSAIRQGLHGRYAKRLVFAEHHQSHAASAFFPSPFEEAAILTLDGVGEWSTGCVGVGRGNQLELLQEMRFPHSLGLLYSAFTYYCGFRVNSGEYKLMGLAPYGQPIYRDLILEHLLDLKPDGSFRLDMRYFDYCHGLTMTSRRLHNLLGGAPRKYEAPLTAREMDLAASIQSVTEEIVLRTARHAHQQTGMRNLVMAGGVALNCVANGKLAREGPFEKIWIQPAAGDAGGALGVALFTWYQLLNKPRVPEQPDAQSGSLLGPSFTDAEITQVLDAHGAKYESLPADAELCAQVAQLVANGNVVGWFQGRMEFGPRALGSRSILADARNPSMQSVLNQKIKFRESFRPFAPIVLREQAAEIFEIAPEQESPYMLVVAAVREDLRKQLGEDYRQVPGLEKLGWERSSLPAITHVDYSARLQTVDCHRNALLHELLSEFHRQTGCPAMINTSFNVRGEPIVGSPEDALRCFLMTDMDALAIGHQLLLKSHQPPSLAPGGLSDYLAEFPLD